MDRYRFFIAVILFLLAWMLALPMRAQSAPLEDIHCTLIQDQESGTTLYQDGACDRESARLPPSRCPGADRLRCRNPERPAHDELGLQAPSSTP